MFDIILVECHPATPKSIQILHGGNDKKEIRFACGTEDFTYVRYVLSPLPPRFTILIILLLILTNRLPSRDL